MSTVTIDPMQEFYRTHCVGVAWERCYRDDYQQEAFCHYATYDGCGHPEHPRNKRKSAEAGDASEATN